MQDKHLIEKLGGVKTVSKKLGVSYQRVFNWTKRGIPPKVILENQAYFKQYNKTPQA